GLMRQRQYRRSLPMASTASTTSPNVPPNPALDQFEWAVQPLAERVVQDILDDAVARSPSLAQMKLRMREETGTRLFDWVDYLVVPDAGGLRESLRNAGFIGRFAAGAGECFAH